MRLVTDLRPDLLCLDMTPEYREALLPQAHQTDIVVVPTAGKHPPAEPTATDWRGRVSAVLRRWLACLQRSAPGRVAVNSGPRHFVADLLYGLITGLAGSTPRRAWRAHTEQLVRQIGVLARRDPCRRVLVAVNVRYCHHIRHALSKHQEVRVVPYPHL